MFARLRCCLLAALALAVFVPRLDAQRPPSPVVVAPVVEQEVEQRFRAVATAVALRRSDLGAPVEGWVESRSMEEGTWVEAGAELLRLRAVTIELQIAAARAELRLREAELAELEHGSRPEEVAVARARLQAAEAAVQHETWNVERQRELFAEKTVTEDELRRAEMTYLQAVARRDELREELDLSEAGPREEEIAQARARLDAQAEQIRLLEDARDKHVVRAPYAGVITRRDVDVGAWANRGAVVAELTGLDPIGVRANVAQEWLAHVVPGEQALVTFDALPGRRFMAQILAVVPATNARALTFPVRLRLDNPTGARGTPAILPGMSAVAEFVSRAAEDARLVPKDALVLGGPAPQVWVVEAGEGRAPRGVRAVTVQVGAAVGEWVQVRSEENWADGAMVVVRGNERLRPGSKVIVQGVLPGPVGAADDEAASSVPGRDGGDAR